MKVLLINPPFTHYGGVKGHGGKSAPLNLGYLASYLLEKSQHKVEILDAEALELTYKEVEKEIVKRTPDIIGITAPTPALNQVIQITKIVKKVNKDIVVVLGGPHPTSFPNDVLEILSVDIAVMGEGEITFFELCEALGKKEPLENIKGIAFKKQETKPAKKRKTSSDDNPEKQQIIKQQIINQQINTPQIIKQQINEQQILNQQIIINPPRELIHDLDLLPFPARHLLPLDLYCPPPSKRTSDKKPTSIIGSRGCPFSCTYCIARIMWGKKYRARSAKNLVDEIEHCIKKYGMGEFNFHDELFTANKQRAIETCREILRRKLNIAWVCMARVDTLSEDLLREMKRAGCKKITFGLESGSDVILKNINKMTNLNKAREAIKLTKKVGIKSSGAFMIGNIGETPGTIRETINFAKELELDTASFFIACPYPGTEFYRIAKEKGYLRDDIDWADFSIITKTKPPLNLPGLSSEDILKWWHRAYREYYFRPRYIIQKITSVRNWEDVKNLFVGISIIFRVSKD